MSKRLRVLLLEDRETDARLLLHALRKAGFDPDSERVDSGPAFLARLDPPPDLILADHHLPQFDALQALEAVQARGLDIPLIVVTGSLGDEAAVECLKRGAADYLLKDRLARLGPAVEQALAAKRLREARREAEAALRRAHDELEGRVRERTLELEGVNQTLRAEVENRIRLQEVLAEKVRELEQSQAEIARQNEQLQALATLDPLTGCLNRRAFVEQFERLWSASRRYGFAVSCVLADVDHFKTVNDRFGHQAGDRVLQHIAATLKALSRASDVIGRYGGEEFCVLLPYTDLDQACLVAERYRKGVAASGDGSRAVTLSLGVTAAEPETTGLAQLLDQADQALYGSKQAGRDRVTRWVAAARRSSGGMPPGAP